MAFQFDYKDPNGQTTAGMWTVFEEAMRGKGLSPGVWFTDGWMLPFAPPSADFVVAEIEGYADYNGVVDSLHQLNHGQQHAVITTFDGLIVKDANGVTDAVATKARCKPLIDAGFYCQYEAYPDTAPDFSNADHCGWPADMVAPVIGVGFNGKTWDQQADLKINGFGCYLAEYLP